MAKPVVSGIEQFWTYISSEEKGGDIFKNCNITKANGKAAESNDKSGPTKYLLLDADGGLDRLYGGFFNDWVHGGQWCRTYQFLSKLLKVVRKSRMELVIVFNGAMEADRICEWFATQLEFANRSDRIVQIVGRRGIPPPKAFWIPPIAVESTLKLIFSSLRSPILVSLDDHVREVVSALQSEPPKVPPLPPQGPTALGLDPSVMTAAAFLPCSYEGLFAESAVYFALSNKQLPRLFSAHSMKLSVKQTLEAREASVEAILKDFNIPQSHMLIFLSLLGSHLLTDDDLAPYFQQKVGAKKNKEGQLDWSALVKDLAAIVREIPETSVDKPAEVGAKLFSEMPSESATALVSKFVEQFNFYKALATALKDKTTDSTNGSTSSRSPPTILESDSPSSTAPSIKRFAALGVSLSQLPSVISSLSETFKPVIGKIDESVITVAKDRHIRGHMHPWVTQLMTQGEIKLPTCIEPHACVQGVNANVIVPVEDVPPLLVHLYRPVRQNAYAVLFDITQSQPASGESKDAAVKDSGAATATADKPKTDAPETAPVATANKTVLIREWFIERANGVPTPAVDLVPSVPLANFANPPVSKLWLSRDSGDWMLRLKTFLNCFKSDAPMMCSTSYVQPHHIVPCAVLRYLLSQTVGILLPHEFDALIAQAVSPALQNPDYLADMELVSISARGIHLSSIFMRGVDHAIFLNDVCGQPIQAEYCAPWLYFDGKLFQTKLSMASQGATPRDLCDGNHEQLYLFSSLRQAILDNLQPHFARYRISPSSGYMTIAPLSVPSSSEILVMAGNRGSASAHQHHARPHDQPAQISSTKGGQLEVGGVVVGHWGGYRGAAVPGHQAQLAYAAPAAYAGYAPMYAPQAYYHQPPQWGQPAVFPAYGGAMFGGPQGRYPDPPGRRGGRGGSGKRGNSANSLTGIGRGRGAAPGSCKGKQKKQPGVGRGGSVIEKGDENLMALEDALETKLDIGSTNDDEDDEKVPVSPKVEPDA